MENNTVIEQENGTVAEQTQEQTQRTFTQAELDEIVKGRLKKESAKYADYEALKEKASKLDEIEEANKTELQKATERAESLQKQLDELTKASEVRNIRDKVASDTGVPASLLTADTEDDCRKLAEQILAFAQKPVPTYPEIKDGGEVSNIQSKKTNGQLFGDWLNAQLS